MTIRHGTGLAWTSAAALVSLGFVTTAALAIWVLIRPSETTFNVVAETERITMRLARQVPWRWSLRDVRLRQHDEETSFTGSIQLGYPVEVTLQRVAFGPLWIHVEHVPSQATGTCEPATMFRPDDEVEAQTSCAFDIYVDDLMERAAQGITTTLTLEGDLAVGRPVGFESGGTGIALLRAGRVTLRERSALGDNVYEAGAMDLDAGDFFELRPATDLAGARGLVSVDERPAMRAAFRSVGREATVVRPGGGEYLVSSTLFQRLINDMTFQVLSALMAALLGAAAFAASMVQAWGVLRARVPDVPAPIERDEKS